jgi:DNA-binding MarR family transcriptional regulator
MSRPIVRDLEQEDFERLLGFRDGLRRFLHWSEQQAKDVGLTGPQHQLLLVIRGHRGDPSIGDVAEHLLLRHHSAVELVDRAARLGLVDRTPDESDHRVVRLSLTAEGEARLAALATAHLEELSRLRRRVAPLWDRLPST